MYRRLVHDLFGQELLRHDLAGYIDESQLCWQYTIQYNTLPGNNMGLNDVFMNINTVHVFLRFVVKFETTL